MRSSICTEPGSGVKLIPLSCCTRKHHGLTNICHKTNKESLKHIKITQPLSLITREKPQVRPARSRLKAPVSGQSFEFAVTCGALKSVPVHKWELQCHLLLLCENYETSSEKLKEKNRDQNECHLLRRFSLSWKCSSPSQRSCSPTYSIMCIMCYMRQTTYCCVTRLPFLPFVEMNPAVLLYCSIVTPPRLTGCSCRHVNTVSLVESSFSLCVVCGTQSF